MDSPRSDNCEEVSAAIIDYLVDTAGLGLKMNAATSLQLERSNEKIARDTSQRRLHLRQKFRRYFEIFNDKPWPGDVKHYGNDTPTAEEKNADIIGSVLHAPPQHPNDREVD